MQSLSLSHPFSYRSKVFQMATQKKYESLLVSFMVLLFGNTFTHHNHIAGIFFVFQNMGVGLFVFYDKKWLRIITIVLIGLSIMLTLFDPWLGAFDKRSWQGILYLAFFLTMAIEVYRAVLYTKTISRELLAAASCGFVVLCLMGTFIFNQVEVAFPHSFSNVGSGSDVLKNLNYFSFTTLLTIGFGDITPVTMIAKRSVMLVGLVGHFYTVFITSIIIGKYLTITKLTR